MKKCLFCKEKLELTTGEHKARWVDTVITVANAEFYKCTGCGRTSFEEKEALRLQALAREAHVMAEDTSKEYVSYTED